jgi:hypothetical protein
MAELHNTVEHPTHAAELVEKIRALIDALVLTPEKASCESISPARWPAS